jgi:predicted PurR-regulated permease PerM
MSETKTPENKYQRIIAVSLVFIATIMAMVVLRALRAIFIPLAFAIFISFIYAPLNRFLIRFRVWSVVRISLLILIIFLITYILLYLGFTGIARFIEVFPSYQPSLIEMMETIGEKLRIDADKVHFFIENQFSLPGIINSLSINQIVTFFMDNIVMILGYYILMIFFSIFFLGEDKNLVKKVFQVLVKDKEKSEVILQKIEKQMNIYILSKTFISLSSSITCALTLWALRVDFPVLSGLLIFMFGYIPNIGSIVACSFPILFCLLKFGVSWQLFATIGSLILICSAFGNLLEPKLMGYTFNLSPIMILVVLIVWGWVWGPVGMLLAVPITVIIAIILGELDRLKPLQKILELRA